MAAASADLLAAARMQGQGMLEVLCSTLQWAWHSALVSHAVVCAAQHAGIPLPALPTFCVLCKISVHSLVRMEAFSALLPVAVPALACVCLSSSREAGAFRFLCRGSAVRALAGSDHTSNAFRRSTAVCRVSGAAGTGIGCRLPKTYTIQNGRPAG